jgi:hypothetical protein
MCFWLGGGRSGYINTLALSLNPTTHLMRIHSVQLINEIGTDHTSTPTSLQHIEDTEIQSID